MSTKADYWKLRESFYKCRDFEINNLWQKSILLTAFFVLDFTIYANVVTKLFEYIGNNNDESITKNNTSVSEKENENFLFYFN